MSLKVLFASMIGLAVLVGTADAGGPLQFSYTAVSDNGAIPQIPSGGTQGFSNYPLFMNGTDGFPAGGVPQILSIELELTGLTHTHPEDLDIYLISPFGETVEIMTDKGDGIALVNATLIFNDLGAQLPADGVALTNGATYRPEGLDNLIGGMNTYVGSSGGTDAWELIIIDDAAGDQGFLTSYTLRGTYIPEPASLALLGLGAAAALRRRLS
jgi:hypothetical protein